MNILPTPQKIEYLDEEYVFSDNYKFDDKGFSKCAEYLKRFVVLNADSDDEINCIISGDLKPEEYILDINDNITISAMDEEGIFRALSTLKQLVFEGKCRKQKIHDYPDIKNRGLMLDISRGKIPKKEALYDIIDILTDLKYNQLQLYMDGFVFEYKHFDEYVKDTCPITAEELREIQDYCDKHFIRLVPNQNGFGHMEKWLAKPELKKLAIQRDDGGRIDTLNPLDEASLEFVNTLYSDLFPHFNSDFANIGMDETTSIGMGQTKDYCEKYGKTRLYIEYLNKIIRLVNEKYHKTPMFWDDIVFEHPEFIPEIDKNSIFMDWGYEVEAPFASRCLYLKEKGLKFYTCPGTSTWGSLTGRFDNMIYNVEAAACSCILNGGDGLLLTEWGDGGNPAFAPMSFLPYIFTACCSWNYNAKVMSQSYSKQTAVIADCEKYADTFIFGGRKTASLLHRMGNYYLLENLNRFNGTYIWADANAWSKDKMPEGWEKAFLDSSTALRIKEYMEDIKYSLNSLDDETPYIDEIRCNCDMVILFAEFIAVRGQGNSSDKLREELNELKMRFTRLWKVRSRDVGHEIFGEMIDKMIEKLQ